jgi:cysteinyl-tRNA synthetase
MSTIEELSSRIEKLEGDKKKNTWIMILQTVLAPMLLLMIGFFLNSQMESAKERLQVAELELKRIATVQQMMDQLFSGTPARAFVAERLLSSILDKSMSDTISNIVASYYLSTLQGDLKPADIEKLNQLTSAANEIQSQSANKILKSIEGINFYIVIASARTEAEAIQKAKEIESKGYKSKAASTKSGFYSVAVTAPSYEEAITLRDKMIDAGLSPKDAFISQGKSWIKVVYSTP